MSKYIEELETNVQLLRTKNVTISRNQDQREYLKLQSTNESLKKDLALKDRIIEDLKEQIENFEIIR